MRFMLPAPLHGGRFGVVVVTRDRNSEVPEGICLARWSRNKVSFLCSGSGPNCFVARLARVGAGSRELGLRRLRERYYCSPLSRGY